MSDTVTPPPRVRERPRKAGSIGTNLKALRSDRGLTIAQMAEASGSSAASRPISFEPSMVPVGLAGFATKTSLVRKFTASRILSTSTLRSCSGTQTGVAPAARAERRYMEKPCSVWMTSVPGPV